MCVYVSVCFRVPVGVDDDLAARQTGIALRSVVCSREPVSPELGCSNLAGSSGAALMPPGRFDMVVELDVASPVPLAQVQIHAMPEDGRSAAPKSIRIEIDSSSGRSPRWRSYASGDMTPFGSFSAENGAKPFARRLKLFLRIRKMDLHQRLREC